LLGGRELCIEARKPVKPLRRCQCGPRFPPMFDTALRVPPKPLLAMILVAAAWLLPSAAAACDCAPPGVEGARRMAYAVFEGYVREVADQPGGLQRVSFEVVRTWKGLSNSEHVELRLTGTASCAVGFERGQSYLVYATGEQDALTTSRCSGTKPMSEAELDLQQLGMGVTPFSPRELPEKPSEPEDTHAPARGGCASCAVGARDRGPAVLWLLLPLALLLRRGLRRALG